MKKQVLIADDETHIRRIVEFNLQRAGYDVVAVEDGEAALAIARTARPALVILDISMPRLTGLEVCRAIKNDTALAGTPVFLLTARGQESDEAAGRAAAADQFFTKPFSPKHLLDEVRKVIGEP